MKNGDGVLTQQDVQTLRAIANELHNIAEGDDEVLDALADGIEAIVGRLRG